MKHVFISITFILLNTNTFSQTLEFDTYQDSIPHIYQYDKYNPIIGGDSIRYCGNRKCNGSIIDKYENGKIKHKGFYTNGILKNGYENFYLNGQTERVFRTTASNRGKMSIFFPEGQIRTEAIYYKTEVVLWKDYYPNGTLEYWEEYDKKLKRLLVLDFYNENGNFESSLRLNNPKKQLYDSVEYYPNGKVHERGLKRHIPQNGGYIKEGVWQVFDENGSLIKTENYYRGYTVEDDD